MPSDKHDERIELHEHTHPTWQTIVMLIGYALAFVVLYPIKKVRGWFR